MAGKHALTIRDRGVVHVHRWVGECACGAWTDQNRRRRHETEHQYRIHVTKAEHPAAGRGRAFRTPTPTDDLPEALR